MAVISRTRLSSLLWSWCLSIMLIIRTPTADKPRGVQSSQPSPVAKSHLHILKSSFLPPPRATIPHFHLYVFNLPCGLIFFLRMSRAKGFMHEYVCFSQKNANCYENLELGNWGWELLHYSPQSLKSQVVFWNVGLWQYVLLFIIIGFVIIITILSKFICTFICLTSSLFLLLTLFWE